MLICLFALVGSRHGEVQITSSISSVGGGFYFGSVFSFCQVDLGLSCRTDFFLCLCCSMELYFMKKFASKANV